MFRKVRLLDVWMDVRVCVCGWMDGWMDGWVDGRVSLLQPSDCCGSYWQMQVASFGVHVYVWFVHFSSIRSALMLFMLW